MYQGVDVWYFMYISHHTSFTTYISLIHRLFVTHTHASLICHWFITQSSLAHPHSSLIQDSFITQWVMNSWLIHHSFITPSPLLHHSFIRMIIVTAIIIIIVIIIIFFIPSYFSYHHIIISPFAIRHSSFIIHFNILITVVIIIILVIIILVIIIVVIIITVTITIIIIITITFVITTILSPFIFHDYIFFRAFCLSPPPFCILWAIPSSSFSVIKPSHLLLYL